MSRGQQHHRWEWDEDAVSGVEYGYCAHGCGAEWHDGDPEPVSLCTGPLPAEQKFVSPRVATYQAGGGNWLEGLLKCLACLHPKHPDRKCDDCEHTDYGDAS